MKRRDFLKSSLALSTLAGLACPSIASSAERRPAGGKQEYYELRVYRLKSGAKRELLDGYIEKAAIPALNRIGIKPVGVFVQQERSGSPIGTEVRDDSAVYVLRTYPNIEAFTTAGARMSADPEYQSAGAEYLRSPKSSPAFERRW